MRITSTKLVLAIMLFFANVITTQSQTLDATFYSPDSSQCIGSIYVLQANNASYPVYEWSIEGPNNFFWETYGDTSPFAGLFLYDEGFYSVTLTVSDSVTSETNTVDSFFYVNPIPLPTSIADVDSIACSGDSILLSASGDAINYTWHNQIDSIPNNSYVTWTALMQYELVATNYFGCTKSDLFLVDFKQLPFVTQMYSDYQSGCSPLTVQIIQNSVSYNGSSIETFEYTFSDDNSVQIFNNSDSIATHTFSINGEHSVSLKLTDSLGCRSDLVTIPITIDDNFCSDTITFIDNSYQDSTIIGFSTSAWIENCTFDYALVTGATINSYIENGDSTIVTWIVSLSTGSTVSVEATYYISPGTTGVYDLILQLYCSAKSGPKFIIANSRLYYEGSTIGIQSNSLSAVHLYPNPAKSTLSISGINESFQFEIRDIQGKLLKQGANNKQIEIENLPAGTYVIGISTDSEVKQLRFVKL
jgi:hypothetical protein